MFGQLLRKEELQIGGKHLGIGVNGGRPLRRPARERRAKKKKKKEKKNK